MMHPKSHSQERKDSFGAGEVVQEQSEAGVGRQRRGPTSLLLVVTNGASHCLLKTLHLI